MTGAADVPAEMAVVGAALRGNPGPLLELTEEDFTDRRCRVLSTVIRHMLRDHRPVDELTVVGELQRRGTNTAYAGADSGFVLHLGSVDVTPVVASAGYYAAMVRTCTRVRMTAAAATKLTEATAADAAAEYLAELTAQHLRMLAAIPPELDTAGIDAGETLAALFNEEFEDPDFVIPDLMARGERTVIIAAEGVGKSTIASILAVGVASGCHPFTGARCAEPARVLVVDVENGRRQTQRRYDWIGKRFRHATPGWAHNIHVHLRTEGLDLGGRDRGWLMKVADLASPDLIVVGPAYKLMRGDPSKDTDVLGLLNALDDVRVAHHAAVFVEAHGGHGKTFTGAREVRPRGSSVWLGWPDVGLGLARSDGDSGEQYPTELALEYWRGSREERDWPALLERGDMTQMPWSPVGTDYWEQIARKSRRGLG